MKPAIERDQDHWPTPVQLRGSSDQSGRRRDCCTCGSNRPADGGCELRPGQWECSRCWKGRLGLRNLIPNRKGRKARTATR